ncbi:MAG TPA: site-2 protease family protein [Candidatus Onthovivens sp.]|nr:site-2 protease family protein [Candidatus Onthovivens sp.]
MQIVLSIVLFFIALGALVAIHEAGHLIAAKAFNVYCSDFSIGFGPKIIKIKRKTGETKFSVGILPLGGYVSMYDDEGELEPGVNVPLSRSLRGISRYKKIIIMASGIIMNFALAFIIFFISASCFEQHELGAINKVKVTDATQFNLKFKEVEDSSSDLIINGDGRYYLVGGTFQYKYTSVDDKGNKTVNQVKNISIIKTENLENNNYQYALSLDTSQVGINNLDYSQSFKLLVGEVYDSEITSETISDVMQYDSSKEEFVPFKGAITLPIYKGEFAQYEISETSLFNPEIYLGTLEEEKNDIQVFDLELKGTKDRVFEPLGLSIYSHSYWAGWDSFEIAGKQWVNSTSLISQTLGQLFVGNQEAWGGVGGPLAIFSQTTNILSNNPFNYYLNTWGIISVNLALFNLLPFPGLDGWQIVTTVVEGGVNQVLKLKKKKAKEEKVILEGSVEEGNDGALKEISVGEALKVKKDAEWRIPPKINAILSYVGLGLLFLFMFVILFKDIFTFF